MFSPSRGDSRPARRSSWPAGGARLRAELVRRFTEHNQAGGGETAVGGDYLEVEARVA